MWRVGSGPAPMPFTNNLSALAVASLAIVGSDSAIVAGKTAFISVMNGPVNQALFPCLKQLLAGSGLVGMTIQAAIANSRMQTVIENYRALACAAVQHRRRIIGVHRGSQAKQENHHG